MLSRFVAFAFSLFLVGAGFAAIDDGISFTDVDGNVYKEAIYHLQGEGVIGGYPDGSYKPDKTINRAEFLKIVIGGRYAEEMQRKRYDEECFDDITNRWEWYVPYACFAKEWGIISGYEGKYLRPENTINLVEAAKIIANAYGDKGVRAGSGIWYQPYMQYLLENRLLPPTMVNFDQVVTRGEMAELISRAVRSRNGKLDSYLDFRKTKYQETEFPTWEEFSEGG